MRRRTEDQIYYEKIGDQFDAWMSNYDVDQRILLIRKLLPDDTPKRSCLEVGCGTGRISEALLPLVKQLTVTDISENLARKVGERLQIPWQQQDACQMSIPAGSFDLIISSECIEHTPDPRRALAEMARMLKKDARIVVTSPNKLWYPVLWLSMVLGIRRFQGTENWLFPWAARATLEAHGITDIRIGGCHLMPWQFPLVKRLLPVLDRYHQVLYPLMINYGISGRKS